MKLINSELVLTMLKAFKDEKYGNPHFMNGIATVMELIEDMPEAVVRCVECRWIYYRDDAIVCANRGEVMQKDDYCSYGERRANEID